MKQITLESQYNIESFADTIELHIKNGQDFPYRIKCNNSGVTLYQADSPRTYIEPKFLKIKSFEIITQAYNFIIKRHNKSCRYMTRWIPINVNY